MSDDKKTYHHGDLKEALLKAAAQELETLGIEGFSLRKVAKRAGVSHAAPAHHFGDANGVLTALAAKGFTDFIKAMQDAEAETEDKVTGAGEGYIAFALANPALFRLIFSSSRPDFEDADLAQASFAAFSHLCEIVQRRVGYDPFQDEGAMQDALAVWSMAHGVADLLVSGQFKPLDCLSDAERKAMLRGLLKRALPQPR